MYVHKIFHLVEKLGCKLKESVFKNTRRMSQKISLFGSVSKNFPGFIKNRNICNVLFCTVSLVKFWRNWTSFGGVISEKPPKIGAK